MYGAKNLSQREQSKSGTGFPRRLISILGDVHLVYRGKATVINSLL